MTVLAMVQQAMPGAQKKRRDFKNPCVYKRTE
jgi:hypothetical protein